MIRVLLAMTLLTLGLSANAANSKQTLQNKMPQSKLQVNGEVEVSHDKDAMQDFTVINNSSHSKVGSNTPLRKHLVNYPS